MVRSHCHIGRIVSHPLAIQPMLMAKADGNGTGRDIIWMCTLLPLSSRLHCTIRLLPIIFQMNSASYNRLFRSASITSPSSAISHAPTVPNLYLLMNKNSAYSLSFSMRNLRMKHVCISFTLASNSLTVHLNLIKGHFFVFDHSTHHIGIKTSHLCRPHRGVE